MVHFTFKNGLAGKSLSAHNSFKSFIIMVVMLVMTASSVLAQEATFEVINGLRYKLDSETKTAVLLPNKYSGDIDVPEKVKGNDGFDYSVVAFFEKCFYNCYHLTSVTIPSSVTSLGDYCFSGCSNLSSITIPSSVTVLGGYCFGKCENLASIYFKGRCFSSWNCSRMGIPTYCDIKVPEEYLQDYKDAFGPDYKYISAWNPNESGDDDKPVTPCATPSIFYGAGKLKFSCETAGAKYHYTISDKDMATDALSEDGNVSLSAAYDISVYATADGYSASEKAKATLY